MRGGGLHCLDRSTTLQETSRGIAVSKAILGASFFLPYLVDRLDADGFGQFLIYAPTWLMVQSEPSSYVGPSLMALLMFVYWLPYVYVGYQSYRFAHGRYPSVGRYVIGVVFVTFLAISFTVPLMMIPRASRDGTDFYSTMIPLPLVSVLALVFVPLLRPVVLKSPWDGSETGPSQARTQ